MELKERIDSLVGYSGKNVSQFAKFMGVKTPQAIREILSGKTKTLSENMQDKILSAFPEINKVWLLSGEGEMLNSNKGEVFRVETVDDYQTYMLPISAMGGELMNIDIEGVDPRDCERIVSPVKGVDMALPVVGDSMAPDYPLGCTVFIKKIDPSFIPWGNVFVLDTTNGVLIKEVQPSDYDDCITCISHNPSGRYKPFDVPKVAIRAMYRVVASMSMR